MRAQVLPLLLAAGLGGLGLATALRARRSSHDAEIRYVGLSTNGSEVLSADRAGVVKRWHAASGRYLGAFARAELRDLDAPWVKAAPHGEVLIPSADTDRIYHGFHAASGAPDFRGRPSAFAGDEEVVTVIGGLCLGWSALEQVSKVTRSFCWKPGIRDFVVDARGEVHALDRRGHVLTVGGTPPVLRREVAAGGTPWTRLASSPSGMTLLVTDAAGRGGLARDGDETVRALPASLDLTSFGFLDEDTVVFAAPSGLRTLSLGTSQEKPFAAVRGSLVAVSARYRRAIVARGQDLFMVGDPSLGGPRPAAWRLRDFLF
jgi:hypothetical protein